MENKNPMEYKKVFPLLMSMAIPPMISMLIQSLYNIIDSIFVSQLGEEALTAVSLIYPLQNLSLAVSCGIGIAMNAFIARHLGAKDDKKASYYATQGIVMSVAHSLLFLIIGLFLIRPFLNMFTTNTKVIEYGMQYGIIVVSLVIGQFIHLAIEKMFQATGNMMMPMLMQIFGAVINIILDPILIFGFNMGVSGAALATIISQALSMLWILKFLTGKKTTLKIKRKNLSLSKNIVLPSIALGLAPFIMQATESLIAVCFNSSLLKYGGDIAVGAMTILTSVMQFSMLPLNGLTQGGQPILSYNYGAKNPERVKKAFKILLISCVTYSMILWALAMITPKSFVLIFNNDPELLDFTSNALRIYMALSGIFGIQIACQQSFIALGNAKTSLFLALLRKIILLIPLIYIMPIFISDKTTAVFMAEPVADFIAVSTTAILFYIQFKKAMNEISNNTDNTEEVQ